MKIEEIKTVLDKFYLGETSLDEEKRLMNFFLQEEVPAELEQDRKVFLSLTDNEIQIPVGMEQRMASFIDSFQEQTAVKKTVQKTLRLRYTVTTIAATLLVLLGIGIFYQQRQKQQPLFADTYKNPDEARQATLDALALFSEKFSKGVEPIEKANEHIEQSKKIVNKSIK